MLCRNSRVVRIATRRDEAVGFVTRFNFLERFGRLHCSIGCSYTSSRLAVAKSGFGPSQTFWPALQVVRSLG